MQNFGHEHFNLGKSIFSIYAWRTSTVWRRERVGRTLMAVEANTKKERACSVNSAVVREAVSEAPAWIQWRWRQRGIEADAEDERAHGVDPTTVEAGVEKERAHGIDPVMVDEAPTSIRWWWRRGRDRGADMLVASKRYR
jgi:hypothetical protein